MAAAAAVAGFLKFYHDARVTERDRADRTPAVAAEAIGAAFVDKNASDALTRLDNNVAGILKVVERHDEREQEDELAERVARRLKQQRDG